MLLYFGDIQNKNFSYVLWVLCVGLKVVLDVCLSLFVGDLVSGGDGQDDSEWGEWFVVVGWLLQEMVVVLVIGNYEYVEEFEDILQECCVFGRYWLVIFVLLCNGVVVVDISIYWFDYQGVCIVVFDGILVLDLGSVVVQVVWLDKVLVDNLYLWSIVLLYQLFYFLCEGCENVELCDVLFLVVCCYCVDLVLQGYDYIYGCCGEGDVVMLQFVVIVVGLKQYWLLVQVCVIMVLVGEDIQLFQVLKIDFQYLCYEVCMVIGWLYDGFELMCCVDGVKQKVELIDG